MVLTPKGPRPVIRSWLSKKDAEVFEVKLSSGKTIVGTGDHLIFADNCWTRIDALQYGSVLQSIGDNQWEDQQHIQSKNSMASSITESLKAITKRITGKVANTCTAPFGSSTTGTSQTSITSTILTKIKATIKFPTWNFCLAGYTPVTTQNSITEETPEKWVEGLLPHKKQQKHGMGHLKVLNGIRSTAGKHGKADKKNLISAYIANFLMKFCGEPEREAFVQQSARPPQDIKAVSTTSPEIASFVTESSLPTNTPRSKPAVKVVGVKRSPILSDVYDLTVADQHCFFAEGVLVHNCHDALQYICLYLREGAKGRVVRQPTNIPKAAGWT
jgi:hypothetical protein